MSKELTIWEVLRNDGWNIRRKDLPNLSINPNKNWQEITLNELGILADEFEVQIKDLLDEY